MQTAIFLKRAVGHVVKRCSCTLRTEYRQRIQSISTTAISTNRPEDECGVEKLVEENKEPPHGFNADDTAASDIKDLLDELNPAEIGGENLDFNLDPVTGEFKSEAEVLLDNMSPSARKSLEHLNRVREDPSNASIMLFPGQGSQFVGMGKEVLDYPNVRTLYDRASEILGFDLMDLCLNGPKHELDSTVHCQPAIVVTSLAALEKLRENNPQALSKCVAAAGYSVGELTALIFSQALSFDDGIKLVKVRARLMQQACEDHSGGLLTVVGSHQAQFRQACLQARKHVAENHDIENPVCQISNYLFPHSRVIGGHTEALKFIQENRSEFGLRKTKLLPVSGAFHTPLMSGAVPGFRDTIRDVEVKMPVVCCHSNINGHKYTSVPQIKKYLVKQLTSPVRWEQLQHVMYERAAGLSFPQSYEVGPSNQLGQMLEKTNLKAHHQYTNVSV